MLRVEEIKLAIEKLSAQEFIELTPWELGKELFGRLILVPLRENLVF